MFEVYILDQLKEENVGDEDLWPQVRKYSERLVHCLSNKGFTPHENKGKVFTGQWKHRKDIITSTQVLYERTDGNLVLKPDLATDVLKWETNVYTNLNKVLKEIEKKINGEERHESSYDMPTSIENMQNMLKDAKKQRGHIETCMTLKVQCADRFKPENHIARESLMQNYKETVKNAKAVLAEWKAGRGTSTDGRRQKRKSAKKLGSAAKQKKKQKKKKIKQNNSISTSSTTSSGQKTSDDSSSVAQGQEAEVEASTAESQDQDQDPMQVVFSTFENATSDSTRCPNALSDFDSFNKATQELANLCAILQKHQDLKKEVDVLEKQFEAKVKELMNEFKSR